MVKQSKKQPAFDTRRLKVRPYKQGDLKELHALYADADNLRYWSVPPNRDIEQTRKALKWHRAYRPKNYAMWAVEEKKSGRLIGMVNYHNHFSLRKRCDVGWLMLPAFQGKGLMTEAMRPLLRHLFDDLGIHKVEALIMPANKPSQALARRLGFRREGGPIRDRWLVAGTWRSTLIFGMISGEETKT